MASTVGLIVNPASGTDIRRAIAPASFVDNVQKSLAVKRLLYGLAETNVDAVVIMPDFYGIAASALRGTPEMPFEVRFLDMKTEGTANDTLMASTIMRKMGVGCIVVLGGDGTLRVASRGSGDTPLLPISTGTNNVLPYQIETTVAGLIAGFVASGEINKLKVTRKLKRLEVLVNGENVDHALVDVASTSYPFKASKAVTDPSMVNELVVAVAKPIQVGLASIANVVHPLSLSDENGLYIRLGCDGIPYKAVVAPGLVSKVYIKDFKLVKMGESIELEEAPTIELDGERELEVPRGGSVKVVLKDDGPRVVDVQKAMSEIISNNLMEVRDS